MGKKFNRLAMEIHREYHDVPISHFRGKAKEIAIEQGREAAEKYIADATAAKVYREKRR